MRIILSLIAFFILSLSAHAANPDERLDDPALEAQAREISKHLRCVVCQNQSIDDSDAQLAKDLRLLVRERLVEGDSPDEVIEFVTDRFGDFVLLKPRVTAQTALLWLSPFILLLFGFWLARKVIISRGAEMVADTELSPDKAEGIVTLSKEQEDILNHLRGNN